MNVIRHYGNLLAAIEEHGDPVCRTTDPEMWFPETGEGHSNSLRYAKELCNDCPLIIECRLYAIAAEEPHGVWGGLDAQQRSKLRRAAKKATSL